MLLTTACDIWRTSWTDPIREKNNNIRTKALYRERLKIQGSISIRLDYTFIYVFIH